MFKHWQKWRKIFKAICLLITLCCSILLKVIKFTSPFFSNIYVSIAELTEVLCANNLSVSSFQNATSFCKLFTSSRALCAPYWAFMTFCTRCSWVYFSNPEKTSLQRGNVSTNPRTQLSKESNNWQNSNDVVSLGKSKTLKLWPMSKQGFLLCNHTKNIPLLFVVTLN